VAFRLLYYLRNYDVKNSIQFYSIEYGPTWEQVWFVLSYSIEYEKHWVVSK
jgi:hypothetical protein